MVYASFQDTPTFRSQSDVRVSVMFEYERDKLPETGIFQLDDVLVPTLERMSVGTLDSPIQRIALLASWPNQSEDVLNEGHVKLFVMFYDKNTFRTTVTLRKPMHFIGSSS